MSRGARPECTALLMVHPHLGWHGARPARLTPLSFQPSPPQPSSSLLSMRLPKPSGPHPIGYAAFAFPVTPRVFGKSRCPDTNEPAVKMEEVAFNLFYPALIDVKPRPSFGVPWVPR